MCLDYAIMPNHVAVFGLSQCDWSQAWFHKRSTVTLGASSAGAITCGHLDSPQAGKRCEKMKQSQPCQPLVGKHLGP